MLIYWEGEVYSHIEFVNISLCTNLCKLFVVIYTKKVNLQDSHLLH